MDLQSRVRLGSLNVRSVFQMVILIGSTMEKNSVKPDPRSDSIGSRITKIPDRCGGDACIRDHRIPVWVLVNYRRLAGGNADLLRVYPSLTLADLEAAWEYAAANLEEIDLAIRENEQGEEGLVE